MTGCPGTSGEHPVLFPHASIPVFPHHDLPLYLVRMKYRQTPISRLADAGKKIAASSQWRPAGEPGAYYRVTGKIMQRVRLESGEGDEHLRLFDGLEPLPPR